ncbi:flagellar motor protein MotB [Nitrospira defluvii]|nr:flagellar motor protein MotB [Nitrospira defluvii]
MARKEVEEKKVDTTAWMATFSDLLSLLLTFFVLLYAMKSIDKGKLDEMLGHFRRGGFGILLPGSRMPIIKPDPMNLKNPGARAISPADIERLLSKGTFKHKVGISKEERGLVLTISSGILFSSGTEISPESKQLLGEIIQFIKDGEYFIQVTGHTDKQPIASSAFKSNMDLSIARAGSVVRYIQNEGVIEAKRLSISGYGDTKPIKSNNEEDRSKNNRVELILLM